MEKKKQVVAPKKTSKVIPVRMDATFFFERAVESLDRLHYDKALKYFRRAAEYEPENPVNHCNMAGILSEMGNYEESNQILQRIVDEIDPSMTECYFYMANNYANMEDYESAEKAIVHYLENDPSGHYLDESEEMMEFLSYELERPPLLRNIKSREGLFEHDRARGLLEEGKFVEAVGILESLVEKYPDFTAARNNLALAYYYMGQFEKSVSTIGEVLQEDPGNLHALCNMAIFHQHFGERQSLEELLETIIRLEPFHQEHVFKLATTMGILGKHEEAYRHFRRLLKTGAVTDPCIFHYAAVAAYNSGKLADARRLWKQAEKADPGSEIPKFYLSGLDMDSAAAGGERQALSYNYHLPFQEQVRLLENRDTIPDELKRDPLIRSSFFWALRYGDRDAKLQVIQAFALIADHEVKEALRTFLLEPEEDDYLKKVALFVLRSMGMKDPLRVVLGGKERAVDHQDYSPNLPVWEEKWQSVMELAIKRMDRRYDMIQQHDLQTLWVEYLTRIYPDVPKISKVEGWAAALEYLTAKMHRRSITYLEVSSIYGVSITTVSKCAKAIDQVCGLKEKMRAIFPQFQEKL